MACRFLRFYLIHSTEISAVRATMYCMLPHKFVIPSISVLFCMEEPHEVPQKRAMTPLVCTRGRTKGHIEKRYPLYVPYMNRMYSGRPMNSYWYRQFAMVVHTAVRTARPLNVHVCRYSAVRRAVTVSTTKGGGGRYRRTRRVAQFYLIESGWLGRAYSTHSAGAQVSSAPVRVCGEGEKTSAVTSQ